MNQNKKLNVLPSTLYNFVANMAKNSNLAEMTENQMVEADIMKKEDLNIVETFNIDLSLKADNSADESFKPTIKPSFSLDFKLLSKAEAEFASVNEIHPTNFLKGCKWSPDGTCILTCSDDSKLRLFDTNSDMLNDNQNDIKEIKSSLTMTEPELIYDYAWYPFMKSADPSSSCIFSTSKLNPIHLFDAYTGQIRCSYKGYNHLDELVNAFSIAFNSSAEKMYCGFNKCIKIFDISRPGKNYQDVKVKSDNFNLPGIISCIAFPKHDSGGVYAVGSYSKYIGIFIESTNEPVCVIQTTHSGGLTQMIFSSDGNKLFTGARKDSEILCWDMRNIGQVLTAFKRKVVTNQRIYFDLLEDKWLCSGNNDGSINIWNITESSLEDDYEKVAACFNAHNDCVNGISFNGNYNLLASSSGQRKPDLLKKLLLKKSKDSSSESENDLEKNEEINIQIENSLKIWKHSLLF